MIRFPDKETTTPGGTLIDILYQKKKFQDETLKKYVDGMFPAQYYIVKAAKDILNTVHTRSMYTYFLLAMKDNSDQDANLSFKDLPFTEEREAEFKSYFQPMDPQPRIEGGNKKRTRRRKSSRRRR